jgi:purine-binding chemotaxis protein CheW
VRALLVPVGPDTYAIDLDEVREVVRPPGVTAVPTAPAFVLGLFNLRGEVVVLLDTGVLVGIGSAEDVAAVVVVDTPFGTAGLSASAATRTADLGEKVGESRGPAGLGRYRVDDSVVTHLDPLLVIEAAGGRAS